MTVLNERLRSIPKVDEVVNHPEITAIIESVGRQPVMEAIRETLDDLRSRILRANEADIIDMRLVSLIQCVIDRVHAGSVMSLKKVINATGVVLHTNLGRSPLAPEIKEQVWEIAEGYSTLEYNIETGKRGSRYSHVEEILMKITGGESALVVNNNAAAVLLILSTLAKDKEVIVSRGELVEIGGSFRVPDVMVQSGAELVEVGTTNKTHLADYERAIHAGKTGALLKVHTSNYRILGFTQDVPLEDLVALGNKAEIPVIHDLGAGALIDFKKYGIGDESTVQDSLSAGADVVCFSGDKLLGGPQAGIIIGKKAMIDRMKKHPLTRAFRIDKLTLAALEATLRIYLDEERAKVQVPVIAMMTASQEVLAQKAAALMHLLKTRALNGALALEAGVSQVGGGSMPLEELPTTLITVKPLGISVQVAEEKLRACPVPIIVRVQRDLIMLDVRTIGEKDFETIADAFSAILNSSEV